MSIFSREKEKSFKNSFLQSIDFERKSHFIKSFDLEVRKNLNCNKISSIWYSILFRNQSVLWKRNTRMSTNSPFTSITYVFDLNNDRLNWEWKTKKKKKKKKIGLNLTVNRWFHCWRNMKYRRDSLWKLLIHALIISNTHRLISLFTNRKYQSNLDQTD